MWVWILIALVFVYLITNSLQDSLSSTASRPVAFLAGLLDGLAMVAMAVGVFGLLMALVLGVFAGYGPRLAGTGLRNMLLWSGGLMLLSFLFIIVAAQLRRLGGRPTVIIAGGRGA